MKRAVQQTLIEFSKASVLDGGVEEYNFSYPVFYDAEEEKSNSNVGERSQNPGYNFVATRGRGGKLRGTSKRSREVKPATSPVPMS